MFTFALILMLHCVFLLYAKHEKQRQATLTTHGFVFQQDML